MYKINLKIERTHDCLSCSLTLKILTIKKSLTIKKTGNLFLRGQIAKSPYEISLFCSNVNQRVIYQRTSELNMSLKI